MAHTRWSKAASFYLRQDDQSKGISLQQLRLSRVLRKIAALRLVQNVFLQKVVQLHFDFFQVENTIPNFLIIRIPVSMDELAAHGLGSRPIDLGVFDVIVMFPPQA